MTAAVSPTSRSLSERAASAGQWRIASTLLQGVLQLGVGVVLARLLLPADFGVASLALVVIGFATMIADLGLGPAVIQRRDLTERHLRVAFTLSLAFGLVLAMLLVLTAPAIGAVTRSAMLAPVLRVQALLFVLAGAGTVGRAMLQRALDFRRLFMIDVTSYVIGYAIVAVIAAVAGLGVWSLVVGALAQGLLANGACIAAARSPARPLLARTEAAELLGFGAAVSVAGLVSYVARNGDNFLVGRLLGAAMLGLYARAFNLMMLPLNYICSALPNVMLPSFAEAQSDRVRMRRGFFVAVELTAMITLPITAGMVVAAPHLIRGLYGARWEGAILPLQILCAFGFARAVHPLAGAVNRASGRLRLEVALQVAFAIAILGGALLGARSGVAGVAALVSVANFLMYLAMSAGALRIVDGRWRAFAVAHVPGILLGAVTVAVTLPVRLVLERVGVSSLGILSVLVVAGVGAVAAGLYVLPDHVRPVALLQRLATMLQRLPLPLRQGLLRVMRVAA